MGLTARLGTIVTGLRVRAAGWVEVAKQPFLFYFLFFFPFFLHFISFYFTFSLNFYRVLTHIAPPGN